uniref:CASP8-associated protein 2 n=1 Tax=Sparus aurata TaxID=8175 RepID=A0A671U6V2_SPAAU
AAQNQIKELRRRLEQMELQNTGLNTENCRLKKNISALLRTARQEVSRKDAEIQRLNQWYKLPLLTYLCLQTNQLLNHCFIARSEKGRLHHQPHNNHQRDQNSFSRTSKSKPPPPPSSSPPPPPPPSSPPPPLPPLPASPGRDDHPPHKPPQSSRKDSDSSTYLPTGSCKTRVSKESSYSYSKSSSRGDCVEPDKQTEHSIIKSTSSSSTRHSESYKHKSKHREEKCPNQKLSGSVDRRQRTGSDPNKEGYAPEKNRSHKADRDTGRRSDSRSCKSRDTLNGEGHHRSERAKSPPPETLASSDNKNGRGREMREDRAKMSTSDSKHCAAHSSKEGCHRDHRKIKTSDGHIRSSDSKKPSSNQHADYYKEREGDRFKERKEKTREALKRSSEEPKNVTEKSSVEENSPNRKLCFMETLNLTLSPIKKPVLTIDASQDNLTSVDEVTENRTDDESSQPNIEDMCVIDEVNSSELQAESEDVAEQSADIAKTPGSEKTNNGCDGIKDVIEKDKKQSETPAANKQLEDKTTSALDTPENVHLTEKSPERSSVKSVSKNYADKTELALYSQVDEQGADDVSDKSGSINKRCTDNSLQKVNPGNKTDQSVAVFKPVVLDSSVALKCRTSKPAVQKGFPADSVKESVPDEASQQNQSPTTLPQDCHITTESSSSTGCIAVSKVSSTTEESTLPEKYRDLKPKKNFSPGKIEINFEPSSSIPLVHDEDSMMRTLSNLKRIPDAISPLRSPIRMVKRSHLHIHGKPGHVKSLQKEFSCSTADDSNSKKLDVNKENKYPGSPANHEAQNLVDKVSDPPSRLSDTELEEGEILSESDETAADPPIPSTKKTKLTQPVGNKSSPRPVLKRTSKERCVTSKETNEIPSVSARSPKSRFKMVCPAATKAAFSTIEDVMETFKLVRAEIRKKYMKLHKTFPKKSFYGVMDNFQESFLEFVDGAHFSQICRQEGELKSNLKKLIASVFSKVSNNGIVKRIFEQQASDLKQKLWDFVDDQVDYLFREVYKTLKGLCKPTRAQAEDCSPSGSEKVSRQPPAKKPQSQQKEAYSAPTNLNRIKPCTLAPYKKGLGSRGKDIRITHVSKDRNVDLHSTNCPNTQTLVDFPTPKTVLSTPEKKNTSLVVPQNSSLLDKTDFELLTEQQASSLTFNLVRDTQMGEIFKCLLQGSDLLENSGITGDNTAWSLGTPRKDGERLLSITTPTKFDSPSKLLSPSKFETPSKLIATWSSISPRKMSSPLSKDQLPLNPALFDESCLLEVPSENRAMLQSSLAPQRSYSILAEDLAVSLTIPSPLKSDSHLSFLQPSSMHIMSTPDSVISAHISEDALLDEEDASEQEIHLALDTDNSSCCSSSSVASEELATPFVFKPDLPMQALVMEKSNDHFIVKIHSPNKTEKSTQQNTSKLPEPTPLDNSLRNSAERSDPSMLASHVSDSERGIMEVSDPDTTLTTAKRDINSTPEKDQRDLLKRKRKKHQEKSKAKRYRKDEEESTEGMMSNCKDDSESKSSPASLSPNSLYAKNVIRKKGEVVMSWTRSDDRVILVALQTEGASRETFSALSEKLSKPSEQIAHRFYQLMKIFKKREKMDS